MTLDEPLTSRQQSAMLRYTLGFPNLTDINILNHELSQDDRFCVEELRQLLGLQQGAVADDWWLESHLEDVLRLHVHINGWVCVVAHRARNVMCRVLSVCVRSTPCISTATRPVFLSVCYMRLFFFKVSVCVFVQLPGVLWWQGF